MRNTHYNVLLDGLDNSADPTGNQGFLNQVAQLSPDAIAEFKAITSNYSVGYGRVGGAVVNSVMRSGGNEDYGVLYDFLRITNLNAIGYIFGQRPATFRKPTLQRNQFPVNPNPNISSTAFGTIRTAYPPRQIQFALKFLF